MYFSTSKKSLLIDTLFVLVNLSFSYSILPHILFFQYYRAYSTVIIILLNLIYLLLRFKNSVNFKSNNILFKIFIWINLSNLLIGSLTNTYGFGIAPFIFSNLTFYFILHNLFIQYIKKFDIQKSLWLILRGYTYLCLISVIGILIVFILIKFTAFVPTVNDVGSKMNLFESNLNDPNFSYYYPLNLSILMKYNQIRIPFFQEYGILTGLYHEPHILTFFITPSYFILLSRIKRRINILFLSFGYILTLLISTSATNLISIIFVIILYLFFTGRKKSSYILSILIILIVFIVGYYSINDSALFMFIQQKVGSSSSDYSQNTILFAFTPTNLIGTSFYNLGYLETYWHLADKSMNVGFINFSLNLIFLIIFVKQIILINLKLNYKTSFYIGLVAIYFFLHSMKITMYSFSLSYTIMIIFLIKTAINYKSEINA